MASIVSDGNISINSTPIPAITPSNINLRRGIIDGDTVTIKVGDFESSDVITLYGDYQQNSVDIPKFDLSKINTLPNDVADFKFILSIKDGDAGEPTLYSSDKVRKDLISKYGDDNPIPVNYLINERKIVVVNIAPFKELIQKMRDAELSINLNRNEINGQVEVTKNLFSYSNYSTTDAGSLVSNPTYDLNELVRYISWVVSKPNKNYDDRLIPANELGEWNGSIPETPTVDTPSTDTTNSPPPSNQYPPIGRAGIEDSEEVFKNGELYVWNAEFNEWKLNTQSNDDVSSGGGGGGSY